MTVWANESCRAACASARPAKAMPMKPPHKKTFPKVNKRAKQRKKQMIAKLLIFSFPVT